MQLSDAPSKIVEPFAVSGAKNTIPVASQIGITPGAASYHDGFPPLTMTPVASGGIPPFGMDMNGILNSSTALNFWNNAGGSFIWDGTFASTVGGYPKGARVLRSDGLGYWMNLVDNNTTSPETTGVTGWVPDVTVQLASITMTSSNVTLTSLQYGCPIIALSGLLTTNLNLIFPAIPFKWIITNNCTGAFTITAKTASGTGVLVNTSGPTAIYGDGTNIYFAFSGLPLAGGTMTGAINEAQGANIASASTINLTTATGNYVHVTGTTTITAITLQQGAERTVVFDGALTLTNGANLILPNGANTVTKAGDSAVFRGESSGIVRCVFYMTVARTWTDVTGSRALTTTYTNSTAKEIMACIDCTGGSGGLATISVSINGGTSFIFARNTNSGGGVGVTGTIMIPGGATYNISGSTGVSLTTWNELR